MVRGPTDNLAVTGVTVTPDSSRIKEGDSIQLAAAVTATANNAAVLTISVVPPGPSQDEQDMAALDLGAAGVTDKPRPERIWALGPR